MIGNRNQQGFTLVEVLISIALLSAIGATFLAAIGVGSKAILTADKMDTGKQLAISQMEYIREMAYSDSYTAASIPDEYAAYTVQIDCESVTSRNSDIQKVVVITSLQGEEVYRLEDYKVR